MHTWPNLEGLHSEPTSPKSCHEADSNGSLINPEEGPHTPQRASDINESMNQIISTCCRVSVMEATEYIPYDHSCVLLKFEFRTMVAMSGQQPRQCTAGELERR